MSVSPTEQRRSEMPPRVLPKMSCLVQRFHVSCRHAINVAPGPHAIKMSSLEKIGARAYKLNVMSTRC